MDAKRIAFIGAGNMAHALIAGIVKSGYHAKQIIASDPNQAQLDSLAAQYGIETTQNNHQAVEQADVVVLAVKPQLMAEVCQPLAAIEMGDKLVISIAAGISVSRLNAIFATELKLVRVMPNTPALLGEGMSGLFASANTQADERTFAEKLLQAVGKTCWVQEESEINTIIAASGSAPAYFFLFMEAMQKAAMAKGLDQNTARLLVQQSALGAAKMVIENPQTDIATLREQVTSKGGTTAEALRVFAEQQLEQTVAEAMQAAYDRGQAMEQLF
ncbi:Pyrroline-5-carboxylate reductase [Vibrio stylophorae]|uniref:Pyrroline-5-carboxylate reductase n=1 Tax=Vibrio stylophorae TaxID=659351 RepID=A0ABN8DN95_9VIBR|nr:pyrroline-5-carboxylate reductase [Vibrio stylophorae]CAH0532596.1 Pyrroline-5-carboxylate reductase [Vibrio stylophorae]